MNTCEICNRETDETYILKDADDNGDQYLCKGCFERRTR
jgi:hypothetical protein